MLIIRDQEGLGLYPFNKPIGVRTLDSISDKKVIKEIEDLKSESDKLNNSRGIDFQMNPQKVLDRLDEITKEIEKLENEAPKHTMIEDIEYRINLGTYKSLKRAKEVIKEIQSAHNLKKSSYQMPKR